MVKNAGMSECPNCKGSGRIMEYEWESLGSGRPLHEPIREKQGRPVTCKRCKGSGYVDLEEEAKYYAAYHAEFLARKEKEAEEQLAKKAAKLAAAATWAAAVERIQTQNREMKGKFRFATDHTLEPPADSTKKPENKATLRPSIAEQLAILAKLRSEGSLTEKEFQTLKTRLISGDEL